MKNMIHYRRAAVAVALLLALTCVLGILPVAADEAGAGEIGRIAGDLNGDTRVDNKDAITLFRYVSYREANVQDLSAVDVNGDNVANNKDAITLFRYVSGWSVQIVYNPDFKGGAGVTLPSAQEDISTYTAIASVNDLVNISANMSGKYRLDCDLTLSGEWTAIGQPSDAAFSGVFDGNGHTISGLSVGGRSGGLFYKNIGTIRNLTLNGASFTVDCHEDIADAWPQHGNVSADFGGIVTYNSGTISKCTVTGELRFSTRNVIKLFYNAISGYEEETHFRNAYTLGGVTAVNEGTVTGCSVHAALNCTVTNEMGSGLGIVAGFTLGPFWLDSQVHVGGIAGWNKNIVQNCTVSGSSALQSNQTADAWTSEFSWKPWEIKLLQPRDVGVNFTGELGSLVGRNSGNVANCIGIRSYASENHNRAGKTDMAHLQIQIRLDYNGMVGWNEGYVANLLIQ